MNSADRCPVCCSLSSHLVYRAADQPILLNQLLPTLSEALAAPCGAIEFMLCDNCDFAWNRAFDPLQVSYGPGYVNDQSHSLVYQTHRRTVAGRLRQAIALSPGCVVEIGCGQGDFLAEFCSEPGRTGIGFDPACEATSLADEVVLVPHEFNEVELHRLSQLHPSVCMVMSRHVLEHLHRPGDMLELMARTIQRSAAAHLYVEIPRFEWIAEHATFFDLFYEHCSLFTQSSFVRLLRSSGLEPCEIWNSFGGQYLSVLARKSSHGGSDVSKRSFDLDPKALGRRLRNERDRCAQLIEVLCGSHEVVIWGAGAKGVSLVNHLGAAAQRVTGLVDINVAKQGRFIPRTGHIVLSPSQLPRLARRNSLAVVVMNPNYLGEVQRQLDRGNVKALVTTLEGSAHAALH